VRSPPRIALLGLLVAVVLALGIAVALGGSSGHSSPRPSSSEISSSSFDGAALPATTPVRDFSLSDQSGRVVTLGSVRGQVTILAFLYSTCGPTCFLIAQQIRGALNELRKPVPVVIVSAEPHADTPARVASFLAQVSLTGRVQYLTGSLKQLRTVWSAYHVHAGTSGLQTFDKYATVTLIDRHGDERVLYSEEQLTPEALAHDIVKLQGG
jgi:protein SCO1/2